MCAYICIYIYITIIIKRRPTTRQNERGGWELEGEGHRNGAIRGMTMGMRRLGAGTWKCEDGDMDMGRWGHENGKTEVCRWEGSRHRMGIFRV